MLASLAVMIIAATAAPVRVAAPSWSLVNVTEKEGGFFVEYFGHQLGEHGIVVTTAAEMATLLGFERQKALLGCSNESSSCAAELAGAIGVDSILVGSLAKFDSGYVVNLKLVAASDGRQLATYTHRVSTSDALLDYLGTTAAQLADVLVGAAMPAAGAQVNSSAARRFWWAPAAVGIAAVIGAIVLEVMARSIANDVASGNPAYIGRVDQTLSSASANQTVGWVLAGVAGACAVAAVIMFIVGAPPNTPPSTQVSLAPIAGGGGLVVTGAFP